MGTCTRRIVRSLFAAALLALGAAGAARATVDFDLSSGNDYLKSFTGFQSNSNLFACAVADFNGDGIDDVAMVGIYDNTLGRTANGAVYLVYGLFKTTSPFNALLTAATSYNLRIDGGSTNDNLANCWAADVNNDGQMDLIIRADGINTLYVLYGPFPNGTGQDVDLSNSASYNVKFVMPSGNGNMYPLWADLNGDGITDTLIEVPNANTNGSASGALYAIYGPLPAGTGNVKDLSVGANFNLRVDGEGANTYMTSNVNGSPYWLYNGQPTTVVADVNGDGAPDLIIGASRDSGWNRSNNGIVYISTGPFPIPSATGTVWKGSDAGRWMLRLGGDGSNVSLARAVVADFNGDGQNDLCVAANYDGTLGRSGNGAVYCLYGPLNYPIDTQLDMGVAANYNVAIHGAISNDNIGFDSLRAADLNGDGIPDLIIESEYMDPGSPPYDGGVLYVINGGGANFPPGQGQQHDLASVSPYYYNLRISASNNYSHVSYAQAAIKDMDGDGNLDIVVQSQGYFNNNTCGSGIGYVGVLYGPTPNTTGNNYDIDASNVDARFHYSNCTSFNSFLTLTGDFDGDGMQDIVFSDRGFTSAQGRVWLTSVSTAAPRITAPGLFTNLTAPTLQWTPVQGASSYRVQVDVDPRFPAPVSDQTVSSLSASVSGLSNGQGYYARVKATNGNFLRWGPIATFTVDTTPPVPPTLIQPGDASGNNPTVGTQTPLFKWTDASPE